MHSLFTNELGWFDLVKARNLQFMLDLPLALCSDLPSFAVRPLCLLPFDEGVTGIALSTQSTSMPSVSNAMPFGADRAAFGSLVVSGMVR